MAASAERERQQKSIDSCISRIGELELKIREMEGDHRPEFIGGRYAVQSGLEGEIGDLGKEKIRSLSEEQKRELYRFIRKNAPKFYTVMRRNMTSPVRRRIDLCGTIRNACRTGGVPLLPSYRKEKESKPALVMLLDISGSCRGASETMLVFMHCMRRAFRGGCRALLSSDISTTSRRQ